MLPRVVSNEVEAWISRFTSLSDRPDGTCTPTTRSPEAEPETYVILARGLSLACTASGHEPSIPALGTNEKVEAETPPFRGNSRQVSRPHAFARKSTRCTLSPSTVSAESPTARRPVDNARPVGL